MKELLSGYLSHNPAELQVEALQFLTNGPYSLTAASGQIIGIRGESGVGKSQFLRAVSDIIPHQGEVMLNGRNCQEFSPCQWRNRVAMVPAESVWWHEAVGDHFPSPAADKLPLTRVIDYLGLKPQILEWTIARLSSGEKQRLALLRAMVNLPSVFLLDEPTANLDRTHALLVEELVRIYVKQTGGCVLIVSHDVEQTQRMCDAEYILSLSSLMPHHAK